jgi:predicted enzyme related to lactoylglutathione lyase
MSKVRHFEICADDPERAVKFYGNVFGWFVEKWQTPSDYWMVSGGEEDDPGVNGAIMHRPAPEWGVVNTIDVSDLEASLTRVAEAGGEVVRDKAAVPHMGWIAYCRDTEGNVFGMMQFDEEAR